MVANVSGNGIGLLNSSAGTLGGEGLIGVAANGAAKEGVYLNVATGNLSLQNKDDYVAASGINVALTRTYNSQSSLNDGNGASWKLGLAKKVTGLTGTANSAGSTVTRIDGDGSLALYRYDAQSGAYVSTDGGGAYQSIAFNAMANEWVWRADRKDVQGLHETYDAANGGRIVKSSDETGVRLTYHYNASNQLAQVHDASGDDVYFDFNNGNLSAIRTVAAGTGTVLSRVSYAYDSLNRLSTVSIDRTPEDRTDARSYSTTYTYAGVSNRIETAAQGDGSKLTFGYQELNGAWKVTSITDSLNRQTVYDYAETGKTVVTDPLGYRSVYTYDGQGQLLSVSTPSLGAAGGLTRFEYDAAGNVTRTIDARGLATDFGYDANGNRILERDAAGNTIKRIYSPTSNQLLQETRFLDIDPDGAGAAQPGKAVVTNYVYDGANHLRFVVSAEGRVDEYRYNGQGQRSTSLEYIDARVAKGTPGSLLDFATLLAWSQLAPTAQSRASRIDYLYDARGLLQQSTAYGTTASAGNAPVADASASIQRHVYDQAGQLLHTIDGNGNATRFAYDGLGRLLATTDAFGRVTRNSYNDLGNRVSSTYEDSITTFSIYDRTGALSAVARFDRQGAELGRTSYAYDGGGRLRMVTDPSGARSFILYDAAGRKAADIKAEGAVTEYRYDANGQLAETIAYAQPVNAAALANLAATGATLQPLTFEQANLRPAPHGADTHEWRFYDSANRLLKVVDAVGAVRDYVYDGASRLIQEVRRAVAINVAAFAANPVAASAVPPAGTMDRITRMAYDNDGLLRLTLDGEGYLSEQKYDGAGLQVETIRYASAVSAQTQARADWDQVAIVTSAGDIVTSTTYDGRGEVRSQTDGAGNVTTYTYDGAGNALTVSRAGAVTRYVYDKLGRVVETHTDATGSDAVTRAIYDKYGNVVARSDALGQTTRFVYDAENRLVFTVDPMGGVSETVYDKRGIATQTIRYAMPVDPALFAGLTDGNSVVLDATGYPCLVDASVPIDTSKTYTVRARVRQIYGAGYIYAGVYATDSAGKVVSNPYGGSHAYNAAAGVRITPEMGWREFEGTITGTYTPAAGVYDAHKFFTGTANAAPLLLYNYDSVSGFEGKTQVEVDYIELVDTATGQVLNPNSSMTGGTAGWIGVESKGATISPLMTVAGVRALLRPDAARDVRQIQRHDQDGRLTWSVDGAGAATQLIYDANGNVVTRLAYTKVLSDAAMAQLAANPAVLPVPAPDANFTSYVYDANQRLVFTIDPLGIVGETSYDALGDVVQVVSYATPVNAYLVHGSISSGSPAMDVDALRALLQPGSASDVRQVQLYDRNGRVRFTIDGAGAVSERIYDASGNVVRTVEYAKTLPLAERVARTMLTTNRAVNPTFTDGSEDGKADGWNVNAGGGTAVSGVNYPGWTVPGLPPGDNTVWLRQPGRTTTDSYQELTQWAKPISGGTRYAFSAYTGAQAATVSAHIVWYDANWHRLGTTVEDAASRNPGTHAGGPSIGDYKRIVAVGIAPPSAAHAQLVLRKGNTVEGVAESLLSAVHAQFEVLPLDEAGPAGWSTLAASESDRAVHYVYDKANRLRFTVDAKGAVSERDYDAAGNLARTTDYAVALTAQDIANLAKSNSMAVNHLVNPTFSKPASDGTVEGWKLGAYASVATTGVNYRAPWQVAGLPEGDNTVWIHQIDRAAVNDAYQELSQHIPSVTAGTRYSFSAYTGAHRAVASVQIVWLDSNGNALGSTAEGAASRNTGTHTGGATLEGYKRIVAEGVAPQGAVRAMVVLRKYNTIEGNGDSWLFAAHAQFEAVPVNGATASGWTSLKPDAGDRSTRYVYDQANRLRYSVDPMGAVSERIYNAAGNVVRTIEYANALPANQTPSPATIQASDKDRSTYFAYDKANRVRITVDAAGAVSERVYDALGNVVRAVEYANTLPPGERAVGSELLAGNRLVNPTFTAALKPGTPDGWGMHATGGTVTSGVNYSGWTALGLPAGDNTAWLHQTGRTTAHSYQELTQWASVSAGTRYAFSAYTGAHRAYVSAHIVWYDASGNSLGSTIEDEPSFNTTRSGGATLDGYKRIVAQGLAPQGAVRAQLMLRKSNTWEGEGDSWLFAAHAQFEALPGEGFGPQGWSTLATSESDRSTHYVYDAANRLQFTVDAQGAVSERVYDAAGKLVRTTEHAAILTAQDIVNLAKSKSMAANHLVNPTFSKPASDGTVAGWKLGTYASAATTGVNYRAPWQVAGLPEGDNTVWIHQIDRAAVNDAYQELSQEIPSVTAGTRYSFSAYTGAHRAVASVQIVWLDSNGRALGSTAEGAASRNAATHTGGATLDGYKRIVAEGVAPQGAVRAKVLLKKSNTTEGNDDSWLFAVHAQFESVGVDAVPASGWNAIKPVAGNRSTRLVYDDAGRLRFTVHAAGAVSEQKYDGAGNVIERIDYADKPELAHGVLSENAVEGALAAVRQPKPASRSHALYNARHEQIYSIDASGSVSERSYDAFGNVLTVKKYTQTIGQILAAANVASVAALTTAAVAGWSALQGLLAAQKTPAEMVSRSVYDLNGRRTHQIDGMGSITEYQYDAFGKVSKTIAYAKPLQGVELRYMPDRNSSIWKSGGEFKAGDTVTATVWYKSPPDTLAMIYVGDPWGERSYNNSVWVNEYGDDGWRKISATRVLTEDEIIVPHVYGDVLGTAIDRTGHSVLYSNFQLSSVQRGLVLDEHFEKGAEGWGNDGGANSTAAASVADLAAIAPSSGPRLQQMLNAQRSPADAVSLSVYDAAGRLTQHVSATGAVTESFYDAFGNLTKTIEHAAVNAAAIAAIDSAAPPLQQQMFAGQRTSADRTTSYTYDVLGRPVYIVDAAGTITENHYDVFGAVTKTTQYAQPVQGVQVWHVPGSNSAISKSPGYFKKGDTVTASVWFKSESDTQARIFLGDANVATSAAYGNYTGLNQYGDGGWKKLTVTIVLDADERMDVFLYGDRDGSAADKTGHSVMFSNLQVSSVQRGLVMEENFADGNAGWFTEGRSNAASLSDLVPTGAPQLASLGMMLGDRADPGAPRSGDDRINQFQYDAAGRRILHIDPQGGVTRTEYDAFGHVSKTVESAQPVHGVQVWHVPGSNSAISKSPGYFKKGDTVTASVWFKSESDTQARIFLGDANVATSAAYGNYTGLNQYGDGGWKKLTVTIVLDADERMDVFLYGDRDGSAADKTGHSVIYSNLQVSSVQRGLVMEENFADGNAGWFTEGRSNAASQPDLVPSGATQLASLGMMLGDRADRGAPRSEDDRINLFQYDEAGRRILHIAPDGAVTRTAYDVLGHVSETTQYSQPVHGVQVWHVPGSNSAISKSPGYFKKGDTVTASVWFKSESDTQARIFLGDANVATSAAYGNYTGLNQYGDGGWKKLTVTIVLDADERMDVFLYGDRDGSAADKTGHSVMFSNLQVSSVQRGLVMEENFADGNAGWFTEGRSNAASLSDLVPTGAPQRASLGAMLGDRTDLNDGVRVDSYNYDAAGRLRSATDASGATERYEYNALGQKVKFINKLGAVWDYEYDDAGRMVLEISPPVSATKGTYDATTRKFVVDVTAVIRPRTLLSYDVFGNLAARTEAQGTSSERTTTYKYDHAGRQIETILPKANVYNLQADDLVGNGAAGNAQRIQSQDVVATVRVTYDALGNAVTNIDVAGMPSHKVYDAMGRVRFEIDAKGQVTEYRRDQFGNATRMIRYAAPVAVRTTRWSEKDLVDALKLIDHTDDRAIDTLYDRMDRVVKVTEPQVYVFDQNDLGGTDATSYAGKAARTTETAYNLFGEAVKVAVYGADASGKQVTEAETTQIFHDLDGRKSAVFTVAGKRNGVEEGYLTRMRYDAAGNLERQVEYATRMTLAEAAKALTGRLWPEAVNDRMTEFRYDRNNRKIEETLSQVTTGAARITTLSYGYDALGNLTRSTDAVGVSSFSYYDAMGRIRAVATPTAMMRTQITQLYIGILNRAPDHDGLRYFVRAMENGSSLAAIAKELIDSAEGKGITGLQAPSNADFVNQLYRAAFGREADPAASIWTNMMPAATRAEVAALVLTSGNAADGADAAGLTLEKEFNAKISAALRFAVGDGGNVMLGKDAANNNGDNARKVVAEVAAAFDVNPNYVDPNPFGNASAGLTEFKLDVYGNAVQRTDYAHGAYSASAQSFTVRTAPADKDRITYTEYDTSGRATVSMDAEKHVSQTAYDVFGRAVKQWRDVTDADGKTRTVYSVTQYDAIGNVTALTTPGANNAGQAPDTHRSTFNAFGELTGRSINGLDNYEYYDYDASGQLWRTNAGDGVDKVMLYDAKGHETAQLVSRSVELKDKAYADAASVAALAVDMERTETAYNLMGHAVTRTGAARDEGTKLPTSLAAGGLSVSVVPLSSPSRLEERETVALTLEWKPLDGIGRGDFKVVASNGTASADIVQLYTDAQLNERKQLTIKLNPRGQYSVKVYKKDVTGQWQLLLNSDRGEVTTSLLKIPAPADPSTTVSVRFIDSHTGAPATGPGGRPLDLKLVNFGDAYIFDTDQLADGKYSFEVRYQRAGDASPYVHEAGTLTVDSAALRQQIGELYVMLLKRAPDSGGLTFWVNALKTGVVTMNTVIADIMKSKEAADLFGGLNDEAIVRKFFDNIGGVAPAAGVAEYVKLLADANGDPALRGQAFATIITSIQRGIGLDALTAKTYRARVAVGLHYGYAMGGMDHDTARSVVATIARTDDVTAFDANVTKAYLDVNSNVEGQQKRTQLTQLYIALLSRAPDYPGMVYWLERLNAGMSLESIAAAMLTSHELQAGGRFSAAQSSAQFVTQLYQDALGRTPDAARLAAAVAKLDGPSPVSRALYAVQLGDELAAYRGSDPQLQADQRLFRNKVAIGLNYAMSARENTKGVAEALIAAVNTTGSLADAAAAAQANLAAVAANGGAAAAAVVAASMVAPMERMRAQIAALYVTIFNRAPDKEGIAYWTATWLHQGATIDGIANHMLAHNEAFNSGYRLGMSPTELVNYAYAKAWGRAPTGAELQESIASMPGKTNGQVIREIIDSVMAYRGADPALQARQDIFNTKVALGLMFAVQMGGGDDGTNAAHRIMERVEARDVPGAIQIASAAAAASAANAKLALTTATATASAIATNLALSTKAYVDAASAAAEAARSAAGSLGTPAQLRLKIVQLYRAVFDRVPTNADISYWFNWMQSGRALAELAQMFLDSPEATDNASLYPRGMNNVEFIDRLYTFVLGRHVDTPGLNYWLGLSPLPSRGALVVAIVNSFVETVQSDAAELALQRAFNQKIASALAPLADDAANAAISAGSKAYSAGQEKINADADLTVKVNAWVAANAARSAADRAVEAARSTVVYADTVMALGSGPLYIMAQLYEAVLGRPADVGGAAYFAPSIASAGSLSDARAIDVAEQLLVSDEARWRYPAGSTEDFIRQIYLNVLGRTVDDPGLAYWLGVSASRGQLLIGITTSLLGYNGPVESELELQRRFNARAATGMNALVNAAYADKRVYDNAVSDANTKAGVESAAYTAVMNADYRAQAATAAKLLADQEVARASASSSQMREALAFANQALATANPVAAMLAYKEAIAAFDGASTMAQRVTHLAELFQALTRRVPDLEGLNYWLGIIKAGSSYAEISRAILAGDEAKAIYPLGQSNAAFVATLYQSVLGRAPEAAGAQYWVDLLNNGSYLRPDLVLGFIAAIQRAPNSDTVAFNQAVSRSLTTLAANAKAASLDVEAFIAATAKQAALEASNAGAAAAAAAAAVHGGQATAITRLYVALIDQAPDFAGLTFWLGTMVKQGQTASQVADSILGSLQASARFPSSMSNADFVRKFYGESFGRAPGADETVYWVAQFGSKSRGQVALEMIDRVVSYTGADAGMIMSKNLFDNKVVAALQQVAAGATDAVTIANHAAAIATKIVESHPQDPYLRNPAAGLEIVTKAALTSSRPVVQQQVDRWGNVVSVSDARNADWRIEYTYNAYNAVTSTRSTATGATTRTEYDAAGRAIKTVDGNGNESGTVYDTQGNVVLEKHFDGAVRYDRDIFGNARGVRQANGIHTGYEFDMLGNVIAKITGKVDNFASNFLTPYNEHGHVAVYRVDTDAVVDRYGYDQLGRRIKETNGAGEISRTVYDLKGNVIKSVDGEGNTTYEATYDAFGHKLTQTVDGRSMSWTFENAFGRVAKHVDLSVRGTRYEYDHAGRLKYQYLGAATTPTISHFYDVAGQLARIEDRTVADVVKVTEIGYDSAGNHVSEHTRVETSDKKTLVVVQANQITYDALNRVTRISDTRYDIQYSYDANGNRVNVKTRYFDGTGADRKTDNWNAFDQMNRQTVIDGVYLDAKGLKLENARYVNGKVFVGDTEVYGGKIGIDTRQGHEIAYDGSGNRLSDRYYGSRIELITTTDDNGTTSGYSASSGYTTETYHYDDANRLAMVMRSYDHILREYSNEAPREAHSGVTNLLHYDKAGRVVSSGIEKIQADWKAVLTSVGVDADFRTNAYDRNGKMRYQTVATVGTNGEKKFTTDVAWEYNLDGTTRKVISKDYLAGGKVRTTRYDYSYVYYDGAKVEKVGGSNWEVDEGKSEVRLTQSYYDDAGNIARVEEGKAGVNHRGEDGRLYWMTGLDSTKTRYYVNDAQGQVLLKSATPNNSNYVNNLSGSRDNATHTLIANGMYIGDSSIASDGSAVDSFNNNHVPVNVASMSASVGTYTVQGKGETFSSIAKSVWGDASLWYVLADANGSIDSAVTLTQGQTIVLPSRVTAARNSYDTFKPYSAERAIGDLSPSLPSPTAPAKKGCGTLGMIIMVVVAVVVTIYTGNPALGSIASQAVGKAIGAQEKFSWKSVALSVVGSYVANYIGTSFSGAASAGSAGGASGTSFIYGSDWTAVAGRAVLANVATQGIAVATNLQKGFDWRSVAAAGVGTAVGNAMAPDQSAVGFERFAGDVASGFAGGIASSVVSHGRIEFRSIAADAFGNALGSSLAYAMQPGSVGDGSAGGGTRPMSKLQAERAQYGGMTQREALGGEKDWLGSLGAYSGELGSPGADISDFRALDASIKDALIPKVEVLGSYMTAEQKLDSLFGIVRETPSLSSRQASEFVAGIWQGVKGIPGGVWEGAKTVADGYRGLAYALTGNIDSFKPRTSITPGSIARGIYEYSPVGILGAMADNNYRGAGNRFVGTAVGLGTGVGLPYLKNVRGLNYDVGVAASRGAYSLGEYAAGKAEAWLDRSGLRMYAIEPGATSHTISVGRNTVTYSLDAGGSTLSASGNLRDVFSNMSRSPAELRAQSAAAAAGMVGDQGGHLVGHRFVLDNGSVNLFPQEGNFNMSAFKTLENDYARFINQGHQVNFNHTLGDFNGAGRPGSVSVTYGVVDSAGSLVDTWSGKFLNETGQTYTRRSR